MEPHISPQLATVTAGDILKFRVIPVTNEPYTWTVTGDSNGRINSMGDYTAGDKPGTDVITAAGANAVREPATVTVLEAPVPAPKESTKKSSLL